MKKYVDAIEKNKQLILDALDYIWHNPETGYREVKTSEYLEDAFEKLGYEITRADGITGFYTVVDTGREGPEVLVLGELDSVICREHPDSDPVTGAVHSCGHCAQTAALLGIAAALREPGVLDGMSGRIRLCAVPAEELVEIEFRKNLIKEGKIHFMGGKPEFLYRGYFDGVDMALMIHTTSADHCIVDRGSYVGCMPKKITYKGVAAHAGTSPQNGINALYAATLGLQAINSLRETFTERDHIRVHPIMTSGGDIVNTIPDKAVIESYIRGASFDAIKAANERVNRALIGAAISLGANVDIDDTPGYAPSIYSEKFADVAVDALKRIMPDLPYTSPKLVSTGSSDIGDLSMIMPVAQPSMMGAVGTGHGADYYISNPELACLGAAKWQLAILDLLLSNGGELAKNIKNSYTPTFPSREKYFEYLEAFFASGDRIEYTDGKIIARI